MKQNISVILTLAQAKLTLEAVRNVPEAHLGKPQLYSKRSVIDEITFALDVNEKRNEL